MRTAYTCPCVLPTSHCFGVGLAHGFGPARPAGRPGRGILHQRPDDFALPRERLLEFLVLLVDGRQGFGPPGPLGHQHRVAHRQRLLLIGHLFGHRLGHGHQFGLPAPHLGKLDAHGRGPHQEDAQQREQHER
jgi:hypothetical protein